VKPVRCFIRLKSFSQSCWDLQAPLASCAWALKPDQYADDVEIEEARGRRLVKSFIVSRWMNDQIYSIRGELRTTLRKKVVKKRSRKFSSKHTADAICAPENSIPSYSGSPGRTCVDHHSLCKEVTTDCCHCSYSKCRSRECLAYLLCTTRSQNVFQEDVPELSANWQLLRLNQMQYASHRRRPQILLVCLSNPCNSL
jgi:hypothetical protein